MSFGKSLFRRGLSVKEQGWTHMLVKIYNFSRHQLKKILEDTRRRPAKGGAHLPQRVGGHPGPRLVDLAQARLSAAFAR
jgi:hypothetical protein